MQSNVKSCNQTEATEVKTAVMERKSVFLPEEVPPTAKAAVTTNGGKSAEAIVPLRGRAEPVRCENNRNRRETGLENGWHVRAPKCRLHGEPRRGTPEQLYSYMHLPSRIYWYE